MYIHIYVWMCAHMEICVCIWPWAKIKTIKILVLPQLCVCVFFCQRAPRTSIFLQPSRVYAAVCGGGCIAYLYLRILPKPFISDAFILVENKSLKVIHVLHGLHLQQAHHTSAHTEDFKAAHGWSHPPIFQATTHPSRLDDNVVRAIRRDLCCS